MRKFIIIGLILFIGCREYCDHVKDIYYSEIGAIIIEKNKATSLNRSIVFDIRNDLSDISFISLYTDQSDFGKYVEIGDSIYKEKESLKIMIYKENGESRLIKLNYSLCTNN